MDITQLCSILEACMSPNQQQRAAAEQTLVQFQHAQGQVVNLLRIAVEPTVGLEVRQAAAISFKNLVKRSWSPSETPSPIPEEDKTSVRENLLEGIIRAPPAVRIQLGECLKAIIRTDYPEKWPALLQMIVQNLATQDQTRIFGCMLALRILARKYEFRDNDERVALDAIVEATFPTVLGLVQQLLATNATSLEAAEVLKLALKSFWSVMYMGVPRAIVQQDQFAGWMTAFHTLMARPVPQEGQPEDLTERKAWPWWKVQKWLLNILHRLYSRYGEAKQHAKGTNERAFAELWQSHCSQQFLEDQMALAARLSQGEYLYPRVVNLSLQYLSHAVGVNSSWKLIKPHISSLVSSCVFPLMCFDDEDAELWEEDPQEYIRKGYDIMEDLHSVKVAATNFIHELCKQRTKSNLDTFMQLLVQVMTDYQAAAAAPAGPSQEQARRMDGALLAIGSLGDILKRKGGYSAKLEPMLLQFVLPAFDSTHGHLRAKACWMAGQFADVDFAAGQGVGPTFNALFARTAKALQDPELPVRVDAVIALRNIIDAFDEDHLDEVKPHIGGLLDQLFRLMGEIDNEDLVFTLETIVEKFGEDMAPYAVGLCQHLTQAFTRLQATEGDDERDEEEGALAAFGCLRALSTVLDSVSSIPTLFPALEPIVFPVLQRMCTSEGQDVYEEIMEILSFFTYFSPTISPQLWSLWPLLYEAYNDWAFDYFENILVPIDNYIARGTDVFLNGSSPNYLAQAVQMAEKALEDSDASEGDVICAPKLIEIILQNCRGRVDQCVPHFISMALARLGTARRPNLRDQLMGVVANSLYYNPSLALQSLQQQGHLSSYMTTWFQMIFAVRKDGRRRHFRRQHDKKVHVLALAAVMAAPDEVLVPELRAGMGQFATAGIKLLTDLKRQQDDFAAKDSEDEGDSEEEEESEEEGNEEDEATTNEVEDDAYMRRLAREAARLAGQNSDGSGSDDEWTDDEEESTALDPIDPFVSFSDTLRGLQASNPARLAIATGALEDSAKAALQALVQHAEHQRAKLAAKSAT